MTEPFGPIYARAYDALYETKDYPAELELLEETFRRFGTTPIRSILDLGSGTGRHGMLLAENGYKVTGVDRSPSMVALAREGAADRGIASIEFLEGDVRSVELDRQFDAVLLMFAVLGYQVTDADVRNTLRTVRRHLRPGGLLVFDVWYGPAVVAEGPTERHRVVSLENTSIERHAIGRLDLDRHLCTVEYRLVIAGDAHVETHETHTVRYFFKDEIQNFLREAGMELLRLGAFPEFGRDPSEGSWNVLAVARAS